MFDIRRSIGWQYRGHIDKEIAQAVDFHREQKTILHRHQEALRAWSQTFEAADEINATIDQLREVQAYHDRAMTALAFWKNPAGTLVSETQSKAADEYKNLLTGGQDKWDVIKAGIAKLAKYYGQVSLAKGGYKSPENLLEKIDNTGSAIQATLKKQHRLIEDFHQAQKLETGENTLLRLIQI